MGERRVKELVMGMYTLLCLNVHTTVSCCLAHGTLLSVMWQPAVWGRTDTCTCPAEPLCFSLETITTLLIDTLYIQNLKLKKKTTVPAQYKDNDLLFF